MDTLKANWIPELHRPANEVLTYIMAVVALIPVVVPILTSADYSTPDGVLTVVIAVATLIARRFSFGPETVAEIAADRGEAID